MHEETRSHTAAPLQAPERGLPAGGDDLDRLADGPALPFRNRHLGAAGAGRLLRRGPPARVRRTLSIQATIRTELDALGAGGVRPFDVHAHTGADVDGTTRSSEEHLRDLDAIGGRSVIFPLCVTTGYPAENRRVVEECRRDPERLVPFARLDPRVS